MIVCRAPFRVSFVGGGTDFEDYYKKNYGGVISTTIDKYIYVTLIDKFDGRISLKYSRYECVNHAEELQHTLAREGLKMFGIDAGVEIDVISDIPAAGSGLGSSSALANALLMAFAKYKREDLYGMDLARKSCELEINILNEPIGRQDQFATALGGLNRLIFEPGHVKVQSYLQTPFWKRVRWLEQATMLFYLNNGRKSGSILKTHKENIGIAQSCLDRQLGLVTEFHNWLGNENGDNERAGEMVSWSWECKKQITPDASNDKIDEIIKSFIKAGVCGAKVCGAGGGGFLMVICDPGKQAKARETAANFGLKELEFKFEREGTRLICMN